MMPEAVDWIGRGIAVGRMRCTGGISNREAQVMGSAGSKVQVKLLAAIAVAAGNDAALVVLEEIGNPGFHREGGEAVGGGGKVKGGGNVADLVVAPHDIAEDRR